jgi:uncharacterized protein YchJ
MREIFGACCAPAARGQATAELAINLMNSRRLIAAHRRSESTIVPAKTGTLEGVV